MSRPPLRPVFLSIFTWLSGTLLAACVAASPSPLPAAPLDPTATTAARPSTPTAGQPALPPTALPDPSPTAPAAQNAANRSSPVLSSSPTVAASPTPDFTPTPDTRPLPRQWRSWPIVPTISPNVVSIFLNGQAQGKNPYAFSILGDCQSLPPVFMGIYNTDRYYLGTGYEYLQETIDFFAQSGSFGRQGYATQNGLSVASALSPAWADPQACNPGESPLACEIRIQQPSIMFINLGTNWTANATASHEAYLRQIVDILLAEGIIPILSTKGDNIEGDWSINQSIAQVAYDYDVPLWNFWAAIQDLPNKGLDPERPGGNYLTVPAWDRRSFTGLQVLDAIRQTLQPYYP